MKKLSSAQVSQVMNLAARNLRDLSEANVSLKKENEELTEKVASFEKRAQAESIAKMMEAKGLEPELSRDEKIEGLLQRDDLRVVEEAVGLSAPQMKLASIHTSEHVLDISEYGGTRAEADFAASLASSE